MTLFRAHAPSLERPLLRRLSALYVLAFIGTSMGYLALGWDDRRTEIGLMMGGLAEEIGASVTADAHGQPVLTLTPDLQRRVARFADRGVVVTDLATNRQIAGPDGFEVPSIKAAAEPLDGEFAFRSPLGHWRYAAFRTVKTKLGAMRVTVVKSDNPLFDVLIWARHELMDETLPTFVPMLIATLVITWLTVRRVLRPLHAVSAEARAIGVGGGETRIRTAAVPQEILPVVGAANAALARLGEALRQQQRFTASAAHELRTPLAVLRARVESSVEPGAAPALLNDIDRLGRTVDQLLTMARFEARQMPLDDKVDVVAIARDCIARIVPLVLAAGKDIVLDVPEGRTLTLRGNGDVVERAICNLVENAVRFTPPGSRWWCGSGRASSSRCATMGRGSIRRCASCCSSPSCAARSAAARLGWDWPSSPRPRRCMAGTSARRPIPRGRGVSAGAAADGRRAGAAGLIGRAGETPCRGRAVCREPCPRRGGAGQAVGRSGWRSARPAPGADGRGRSGARR